MAVNKVIYGGEALIDISDSTVTPNKLIEGETAYGANGEKVVGAIANLGSVSDEIDGLTETSKTISAGYTSGGVITLTNDIENALKAI